MNNKISNTKKNKYKQTLDKLLSDPILKKYDELIHGLKQIKEDLDSNEYRITIVGEFSTGKSTFLNALMGKDILPHGVEETTATVTYIHNVKTDSANRNKVKVHFRNHEIKDIEFDVHSSAAKFIEFITAKSNRDVVREIESVDVYINFMGNEENVVLVDTPGLNGMAKGMRDITLREIERSHANIFLFGIEGIKASDRATLSAIYKEKFPYFFIMNQIDRLIEEIPEKRLAKFKTEVENNITQGKSQKHIYGVSSLKALVAKDRSIKKLYSDREDLIETDRINLLEESNLIPLENNLYSFLSGSEKENRFLDDVKRKLLNLLHRVKENLELEKGILEAKIQDIPSKNILKGQKDKVLTRIDNNKQIIRNKVINRLNELEKEEIKIRTRQCEDENERWLEQINSWDRVEIVENSFKQNTIPNLVNIFYTRLRVDAENSIKSGAKVIYRDLIDLVHGFVPQARIKDGKVGIFESAYLKDNGLSMSEYHDTIKSLQEEINKKEKNLQNERTQVMSNINQNKLALDQKNKEKVRKESEYYDEKSRLGRKPSYREWSETSYERRWYTLGLVKHKVVEWFGNQEEIDKWNKENQRIERKKSKITGLETVIRQISSQINREQADWKRKEATLTAQIEKLKQKKIEEEKEMEMMKKIARTTFISQAKKNIKQQLATMVNPNLRDGGVLFMDIIDNIKSMIRHLEGEMQEYLDTLYVNLINTFLNNIKLMEQQLDVKYNVEENNIKINELTHVINHINYIINGAISRL